MGTEYPEAGNIRIRHGCSRPIISTFGIQHRAGGSQSEERSEAQGRARRRIEKVVKNRDERRVTKEERC